MPPSFAPAPFYGDNVASLDSVRRIRFSRLFDSVSPVGLEEKPRKSISPKNSRFKGVKLFANISHGVKKAKPKKPKPLKKIAVQQVIKTKPVVSVREKMRDKFDFSRTPYSISVVKKPRVLLTEEDSKTRKFFKTTVETKEVKKPVVENSPTIMEFEDLNDAEEEPFVEIKKGVSSILDDWFDEDYLKPQITRQLADESLNPITTPNKSYITLANVSPRTPLSTNVEPVTLQTPKISNIDNQENSPASISLTLTPVAGVLNTSTPEQTPKTDSSKKFYPLFTPSSGKKVLSDVTNKKKRVKILDKAANQYQIDAGQKVIGPKECASCGMVFDIGDPFDAQRHDKYHNGRKDIKFKISKMDNIVGHCGNDRIVLVKHSDDTKKRNKVIEILKLTEEDIGTGYSFEPRFLAFLYIRNDAVLGCLIAEPNVNASRIIHSKGIVLLSEDKRHVKCGINRVWVKSEFRGQKIATELLNCLRKNFVFGEILEIDDVAFSPTTPDGDVFAIKYCNRHDYLSYVK